MLNTAFIGKFLFTDNFIPWFNLEISQWKFPPTKKKNDVEQLTHTWKSISTFLKFQFSTYKFDFQSINLQCVVKYRGTDFSEEVLYMSRISTF